MENQALHKLLAEQAEEMEKLKSYVAVEHKEKARGASICWFLLFVCLTRSFDWLSTREALFFFHIRLGIARGWLRDTVSHRLCAGCDRRVKAADEVVR